MSIAVVQSTGVAYGAGITSLTLHFALAPVTAGNTILVGCFGSVTTGNAYLTFADSGNSGNYTNDIFLTALGVTNPLTSFGGSFAGLWRFSNSVSGNLTITLTLTPISGGVMTGGFSMMEVSGLANTSPVDNTFSHHALSGNPSTGTFSTLNANDLIFCTGMGTNGSNIIVLSPSGFTSIGTYQNGATNGFLGDSCYEIVSATQSSIDPTWSFSGGSSNPIGVVAAYVQGTVTPAAGNPVPIGAGMGIGPCPFGVSNQMRRSRVEGVQFQHK